MRSLRGIKRTEAEDRNALTAAEKRRANRKLTPAERLLRGIFEQPR